MISRKEKEVVDALKLHTKLKQLRIDGYRDQTFADRVTQHSFGDMVAAHLLNCPNCCLLPPLGQLTSLIPPERNWGRLAKNSTHPQHRNQQDV